MMSEHWRVGRSVGRTIYLNDELVGLMDTPELAARVVAALAAQPQPQPLFEGTIGKLYEHIFMLIGSSHDLDEVVVYPAVTGSTTPMHVLVDEGWWHPNVKSGQVHLHPENPGRSWSSVSHRQCEEVYTRRAVAESVALPRRTTNE